MDGPQAERSIWSGTVVWVSRGREDGPATPVDPKHLRAWTTPDAWSARGRRRRRKAMGCPYGRCQHRQPNQADYEPLPDYYVRDGVCEDRRLWLWWRWVDRSIGWELHREIFGRRAPGVRAVGGEIGAWG